VNIDEKKKFPLVWWKNNNTEYPKLAKNYLATLATSVSFERVFNIAEMLKQLVFYQHL